MPEIEAKMRDDIAAFLPAAIEVAILSYQRFAEEEASAITALKAKEFKLHHDACKMALAHIELLLKLVSIAGIEPPENIIDLEQIIANAHNLP
ncbi:MAG: hypothetical protein CMH26_05490 [Micavibrio sp.]|nr:hypothetical protein [Micavibrio sp.]|tara:strand:+ start:878 stop:1156 length:279 start_codon:yes stop_codon:yes gene_type:complete